MTSVAAPSWKSSRAAAPSACSRRSARSWRAAGPVTPEGRSKEALATELLNAARQPGSVRPWGPHRDGAAPGTPGPTDAAPPPAEPVARPALAPAQPPVSKGPPAAVPVTKADPKEPVTAAHEPESAHEPRPEANANRGRAARSRTRADRCCFRARDPGDAATAHASGHRPPGRQAPAPPASTRGRRCGAGRAQPDHRPPPRRANARCGGRRLPGGGRPQGAALPLRPDAGARGRHA